MTTPLKFAVVTTLGAVVALLVLVFGVVAFFVGLYLLWGAYGFWGIVFGIPALALLVVFVEAYAVQWAHNRKLDNHDAPTKARSTSSRSRNNTVRRASRAARGRGVMGRSSRSFRSR